MGEPRPPAGTEARRPASPRRSGTAPERRIEVLPDLPALRWAQPAWWPLWRRTRDATPFQSPAWVLCRARHDAPGRTGAIDLAAGGDLLALLPYYFWQDALGLAGTGPGDYGDALVAATFTMHAHRASWFYSTGFDPAWSRFSPGLLSIAAALGGAAAEGDRTAFLLRGREPYESHLGAVEGATWRRVLRRAERSRVDPLALPAFARSRRPARVPHSSRARCARRIRVKATQG